MTRFARAKGSKASNERVPEEATSWSEMKQQLLEKNKENDENKKRKEALDKRNANYKAFLEEKERENSKDVSWAEFPGTNPSIKEKKSNKKNTKLSVKKSNKILPGYEEITGSHDQSTFSNINENDSDDPPEEQSSKKEIPGPILTKKKDIKSKKLLKITVKQEKKSNNNIVNLEGERKLVNKRKATEHEQGIKKKIKKNTEVSTYSATDKRISNPDTNKKKKVVKENLTEKDLKKIEKKKQRRLKQVAKKELVKKELKRQMQEQMEAQENSGTNVSEAQTENQNSIKRFDKSLNENRYSKPPFDKLDKKKNKKVRDNEEHPRKKPLLPHKMFINGKELEINYVDGFPVKKEDALRIKKLRREMISKGLPRSEINIALKLERRKAEKAFAREKKKVY